jgi:hypothetical protein
VAPDPDAGRKGTWVRRTTLTLLAAVVVVGLIGLLGVRSASVRAGTSAVQMTVRYPRVARAGLDVPFAITIKKPGGFDGDIVLMVSSEYLGLFDRNAITPQPASENSDGSNVFWRFDQPAGTAFAVSLDMQVQEGRHWGRSGTVTLLDESHRQIAHVSFTTRLAP